MTAVGARNWRRATAKIQKKEKLNTFILKKNTFKIIAKIRNSNPLKFQESENPYFF